MTSEKLARWRAMGYDFPAYYDDIATREDERNKKAADNATIHNIELKPDIQKNDGNKYFNVKVTLNTDPHPNTVFIEIDGNTFQAFSNIVSLQLNVFYAKVFVTFSSVARLTENFKLTAFIKNQASKAVIDSKSMNVKVTNDGRAEETDDEEEEEILIQGSCGVEYKNLIKCTRFKLKKTYIYGPFYQGNLKMKDYGQWDNLLKSNKITFNEKLIVIAMSENEANLDGINGYDDQIVSIGAMQKTINKLGYGELPIQIWEFGSEHPEKYKTLLTNCGWKVKEEIVQNTNGKEIPKYKIFYNGLTGKVLFDKLRNNFNSDNFGKKVECVPIEPLIALVKDADFQAKQIEDFIERLNQAIQKKPTGYALPISSFVKSKLGKALILDNDVNRPAQTKTCFGKSLDLFFVNNPTISKNPDKWLTNFDDNESQILTIYGPLRGRDAKEKLKNKRIFTMTDAKLRFENLKSKLL